MFHRYDLAIVNKTFWPKSLTLGEGHLQLAEKVNKNNMKSFVISQKEDISKINSSMHKRFNNVKLSQIKALTNSSSGLLLRIIDSIIFTLWVSINLCLKRPKIVYVATDPPIIVPFIVFLYSKIFRARYVYHYQDIHPEITNVLVPLNKYIYQILLYIDKIVQRNASKIITINNEMKNYLLSRTAYQKENIKILENPTVLDFKNTTSIKNNGFVFCGNAGRLQRITFLLKSIETYITKGGRLPFKFIGGGIFKNDIKNLASKFENVDYLEYLPANECNKIISDYEWALLPIEDEITSFAFPSKTSSYLAANSKILSICSEDTGVAKWVIDNKLGLNITPNIDKLVNIFFMIERNEITVPQVSRESLISNLSPGFFANEIYNQCFD